VLGGELELTNLKKSMVQGRERKLPLPMKNAANAHQIIVGVLVRRYRADTLPLIEGAVQAGQ